MLDLFKSIFGGNETPSHYPESLIERAIDRVVAGSDSHIQFYPGYKKIIREPVIQAMDHVVSMIDDFPEPADATPALFQQDARLNGLFSSSRHMMSLFSEDDGLSTAIRKFPPDAEQAHVLLGVETSKRSTLGMELVDDSVQHGVAQTVISFKNHRLIAPSPSDEEMRKELKRRAFDHLIHQALMKITEAHTERVELDRQRVLLKRKLSTLSKSQWHFIEPTDHSTGPETLQAEYEEIEKQLAKLGPADKALKFNLELVCEVLSHPDQQLHVTHAEIYMDQMNIERNKNQPGARQYCYDMLENIRDHNYVLLPVRVNLKDLS